MVVIFAVGLETQLDHPANVTFDRFAAQPNAEAPEMRIAEATGTALFSEAVSGICCAKRA